MPTFPDRAAAAVGRPSGHASAGVGKNSDCVNIEPDGTETAGLPAARGAAILPVPRGSGRRSE